MIQTMTKSVFGSEIQEGDVITGVETSDGITSLDFPFVVRSISHDILNPYLIIVSDGDETMTLTTDETTYEVEFSGETVRVPASTTRPGDLVLEVEESAEVAVPRVIAVNVRRDGTTDLLTPDGPLSVVPTGNVTVFRSL